MTPRTSRPLPTFELVLATSPTAAPAADEWLSAARIEAPDAEDAALQLAQAGAWLPLDVWARTSGERPVRVVVEVSR